MSCLFSFIDLCKASCGWDLLSVLFSQCCEPECAVRVYHLMPGDISYAHHNIASQSPHAQIQWLLDNLNSNCSHHGSRIPAFNFMICGKTVCKQLWLKILHLSAAKFNRLRLMYLDGKVTIDPHFSCKKSIKSNEAVGWMKSYFSGIGDKMPDKVATHLPSSLTVKAVHERIRKDCGSEQIASQAQFYQLWRKFTHDVKVPAVS